MFLIKMLEEYKVQYHDFLLKYVTEDLEDFKLPEIGKDLKALYEYKDPNISRMTSIINAIYTHRMQTFMLTARSLEKLLKADSNQKYKSVSGSIWGSVRDAMKELGHFEEVREPTNGKAGVYKLIYQPAVDKLYELHDLHVDSNKSIHWFPQMESKLLGYWDNDNGEGTKKPKFDRDEFMKSMDLASKEILEREDLEDEND